MSDDLTGLCLYMVGTYSTVGKWANTTVETTYFFGHISLDIQGWILSQNSSWAREEHCRTGWFSSVSSVLRWIMPIGLTIFTTG